MSKEMPWFRVYPELETDPIIDHIASEMQYSRNFTIGLWVRMLMIAADSPVRGSFYTKVGLPTPPDILGKRLDIPDDIGYVLQLLEEFTMIDYDELGAIRIAKWEKRQYTNNPNERMKKYRERRKRADVTPELRDGYAVVTPELRAPLSSVLCNLNTSLSDKESLNTGEDLQEPEIKNKAPAARAQDEPDPVIQAYENSIGFLNGTMMRELDMARSKYPDEWVVRALRETAMNNAHSFRYTQRILERWETEGGPDPAGSNGRSKKKSSLPPGYRDLTRERLEREAAEEAGPDE